jgi:hypothetical protein
MDVNAVVQNPSVTLVTAAWKVANNKIFSDTWQVYFDTNRLIREAFGEAGHPAPRPAYAVSGLFAAPLVDPRAH